MKKREDNTVVFMAKKNGTSAKGQQNDAPKILAGDLTDLQINAFGQVPKEMCAS